MAPPTYADLGKSSRDVFSKGYHFGLLKLEVKTKSEGGIEFTMENTASTDGAKGGGHVEAKYKLPKYGLTLTEKWTMDNQLNAKVDVQDQMVNGLKLTFDTSLTSLIGAKSGKVKAEYKHDMCTVNADVDLKMGGPMVDASAVVGHNGWLAGYQTAFDLPKSKVTKNNFSFGYTGGDLTIHTNVNNGQIFGANVYQKVNRDMEAGFRLGWSSINNMTKFGIACKYNLEKDFNIRAKVNNYAQIGLGCQQKLRDGMTLSLSALFDGKNFNQDGHKFGIALELQS